ncbi:hypothetical protein [Psychrobacter frigidicola]|uniref:hypothetical protein n=1 Tax=Psychrobacter frigidicola TaxID=45611 RepID=UPI0019186F0A|nr:hypothetical protein [Psychrobacter frigidicola]
MADDNVDKSLPNDNSDFDVETEKMKLALSEMTDEDMQNIFDRAFDSLNQKMLNSKDNKNK